MKLRGRIKSLQDVPEAMRPFYVELAGEYVLQVEGMVPKERLDQFRESNISLRQQIEELGGSPRAGAMFNGA